ncbi:MAG: Nitronate monooxygenase [Thermotogae bacterium ADurb.Bin062]|nr:MAG: Nitronate monooxygenase [Thermotogota bacterium ADurb.Bin062]
MIQLPELRIGDNVIPLPIVQGGMGVGISLAGLASAVANEGGIGVIASAGIGTFHFDWNQSTMSLVELDREGLRLEIHKAQSLSKGWIGVNIMAALIDFSSLLRVALEEGADFIFIGAGLPFWDTNEIPLDVIHRTKTKLVPIVSSAKAARLIFQYWDRKYGRVPDALVLEGPKAGGHLGFSLKQIDNPAYQLEQLIPQMVEQVKELEAEYGRPVPIIAAGGIFTGGDIRKVLEMGVQGVQMSTRFVGTFECDASDRFKEAYLRCGPEDITIIKSPVGLPGRALRNQFIIDVEGGLKKPFVCPYHCLSTCDFINAPYCIAMALTNAQKGILEEGFVFCGANAHRVKKIVSVKELIQTIKEEYRASFENDQSPLEAQRENMPD